MPGVDAEDHVLAALYFLGPGDGLVAAGGRLPVDVAVRASGLVVAQLLELAAAGRAPRLRRPTSRGAVHAHGGELVLPLVASVFRGITW